MRSNNMCEQESRAYGGCHILLELSGCWERFQNHTKICQIGAKKFLQNPKNKKLYYKSEKVPNNK